MHCCFFSIFRPIFRTRHPTSPMPMIRNPTAREASDPSAPGPVVMRQSWNHLFFLHWVVPPDQLRSLLPPGLTIDEHEGDSHVAIVGFLMDAVRPRLLPSLPWISFFRELNVRLYVRDPEGRPGVFFLSLDCDRAVAVWIARTFFSLPYRHASIDFGATQEEFTFRCRRRGTRQGSAEYAWQPVSTPRVSKPGTLDFHLLERYRFFTHRHGELHEGRVRHPPYEVAHARFSRWSGLPLAWNGLPLPERPPDLAHYCRGVSVEAFALRRWDRGEGTATPPGPSGTS
jgi:uncharacterized protein YqjF (DUF2071 family)